MLRTISKFYWPLSDGPRIKKPLEPEGRTLTFHFPRSQGGTMQWDGHCQQTQMAESRVRELFTRRECFTNFEHVVKQQFGTVLVGWVVVGRERVPTRSQNSLFCAARETGEAMPPATPRNQTWMAESKGKETTPTRLLLKKNGTWKNNTVVTVSAAPLLSP